MSQNTTYPAGVDAAVAMFCNCGSQCECETDCAIKSSFEQSYVYKTYLKNDVIITAVKDGVILLTGTVAEGFHWELAQETAKHLPGVIRVENHLTIAAEIAAKLAAKIAAENADKWIGSKVKLNLLFHRNLDARDTSVGVKDGIVTLKGEASSIAQKELIGDYAKDIEGVKGVNMEMTVGGSSKSEEQTSGETIDDASVTAQVKMALMAHRSTSSITTNVETRDGEVLLTGVARNAAEKVMVARFISDIRGVRCAKNTMTVKEA